MNKTAEIVISNVETSLGPGMILTPNGEKGAIFAAEFYNTSKINVADNGERRLLCQWPSLKSAEDFKNIVDKHSHAAIVWVQNEHELWGNRRNGEFALEKGLRPGGWMPRATRSLVILDGAPKDQVLEEIVRVVTKTVFRPGLLPRKVLRESLREFANRRFHS